MPVPVSEDLEIYLCKNLIFDDFQVSIEGTYSVFFEKMAKSRPPLFFNFRGGLPSSLLSKKSSKTLKTAILPSKTLKMARSRYFSTNCSFKALRVVFGKN